MVGDRSVLERRMEHFWELLNEDMNDNKKEEEVGAQTMNDDIHMVDYPMINEMT